MPALMARVGVQSERFPCPRSVLATQRRWLIAEKEDQAEQSDARP